MRRSIIALVLVTACASTRGGPLDPPIEAARHRAALASVTVSNATNAELSIAFRAATPPMQEVTIGKVGAAARARMAPVPAGEPIILIARRADGYELVMAARSLPLDVDWTWEIPRDANFVKPALK
jgi:hypothetical protein